MKHAFKEWAVICKALAEGRQAIVLRKGGIAEKDGLFRPEHTSFWLYPTYLHQQEKGIKAEALPLLEAVNAEKPAAGTVCLSHYVEVPGVYHVNDLTPLLLLAPLHLWSEETVKQRFAYRQPGLYVLPVRVHRALQTVKVTETPEYAGCKSWVELDQDLSTAGAKPVLDDDAFQEVMRKLDALLNPTALA
ncbi:MAG: DUF1802 family protein [Mariprofundaceae bacterium]|nr:DUF1802 family protein [Mariprofundaceae bacterium]